MIKKFCGAPGCFNLVEKGTRYCDKHEAEMKERQQNRKPFENAVRSNEGLYNTARWRNMRKEILKENGYCVYCGSREKLTIDHIIPPRGNEELFFSIDNLQSVCSCCHRLKTNAEIRERNKYAR